MILLRFWNAKSRVQTTDMVVVELAFGLHIDIVKDNELPLRHVIKFPPYTHDASADPQTLVHFTYSPSAPEHSKISSLRPVYSRFLMCFSLFALSLFQILFPKTCIHALSTSENRIFSSFLPSFL